MRILLIGNSYINTDIINEYLENKHIFIIVSSDIESNKILDLIRQSSIDILIFNGEINYNQAAELLRNIKKNHLRISSILLSPVEKLEAIREERIESLIDDFIVTPVNFIEFSMRIRKVIRWALERRNSQVISASSYIDENESLYLKALFNGIQNYAEVKEQEPDTVQTDTAEPIAEKERPAEETITDIEESALKQEKVGQANEKVTKPNTRGRKNILRNPILLKVADITGKIVFGILIIVLAILAFFLIQSKITGGTPSIAGRQIYMALSGSMSPTFDTGSLVFVKPIEPSKIKEGDIITFRGSSANSALTTHRVLKINNKDGLSFTTKGDANNVSDPNPVSPDRVVGKVIGHIAYLGYLMGFAQTKQGLIILVFIPGVLIIIYELKNIFKITQEIREGSIKEKEA